jgi:hypothetical protein
MRSYLLLLAVFFLSLAAFTFNKAVAAAPYDLGGETERSSAQDSSPSLEETLQWIQARLSSDASFSETKTDKVGSTLITYYFSDRVTVTDWEGCTLKFASLHQHSNSPDLLHHGVTRSEKKTTVRLADVTLAKVTPFNGQSGAEYYILGLMSDNKFLEETEEGTHPSIIMIIPFKDREVAERVAKAVNHAMSLCKGKKEPF